MIFFPRFSLNVNVISLTEDFKIPKTKNCNNLCMEACYGLQSHDAVICLPLVVENIITRSQKLHAEVSCWCW